MTERDADYERWQLTLKGLTELSTQYQQLNKSVQTGFSFLSDESAVTARRLTRIEAKLHTMEDTLQRLLPDLATIAAYLASQQQKTARPPVSRRQAPRRVNGE